MVWHTAACWLLVGKVAAPNYAISKDAIHTQRQMVGNGNNETDCHRQTETGTETETETETEKERETGMGKRVQKQRLPHKLAMHNYHASIIKFSMSRRVGGIGNSSKADTTVFTQNPWGFAWAGWADGYLNLQWSLVASSCLCNKVSDATDKWKWKDDKKKGHLDTHIAPVSKKPKPWTTYCFSLDPLLPFVVFARVRVSVKLTCKSLERAGLIVLTLTRLLIIQKGKWQGWGRGVCVVVCDHSPIICQSTKSLINLCNL